MNYNFWLNHILIIQKKLKISKQKKGGNNKHTHSSTSTIRILHIPIMLHKLLAFDKDHIWGISLLINKEHGRGKALNIMQQSIPSI